MQQPPYKPSTRSLHAGRTNPALPGVNLPTTPVYVSGSQRQRWPQFPTGKQAATFRRVFFQLTLVGLGLAVCFWLVLPLSGEALPNSFLALALPRAFPWLTHLLWTQQFPGLAAALSRVPWLHVQEGDALSATNLALLILTLAGGLLLGAARVGRRATRERFQKGSLRPFLSLLCLFTLLFGMLFVLLPGGLSQETLLAGLDGRLILVYHANPYLDLAKAGILTNDPLYRALAPGTFVAPQAGPLWLDLTVFPAWLARDNPVMAILTLRVAGLGLHLANALLLWGILSKLKPEVRLTGTLLYAWNPAILWLGISESPLSLATIFFLLAGAFLLQRRSLLPGWTCFVLAALVYPLCLLLLPLFLRALGRGVRLTSRGGRVVWWLMCALLGVGSIALAYAPYWSGLGISGILFHVSASFWQNSAQSSLLAALDKLPFAHWSPTAWLLTPHHWLLLPALTVSGLLLLGIWITDNLELALLFGSWIFLALFILLPINTPWSILLPLALALASTSRRTILLAHLLTIGALIAYGLAYWPNHWDGQALVTVGLAVLIWGWTLFFLSTWQMTHHDEDEEEPPIRKRLSLSRPSWPSRPAAWPSRPARRGF